MSERGSVATLTTPDVLLVLIVAVPALALGAPAFGYAIGAAAWIVQRIVAAVAERRISEITEVRRRLGYGVASSMGRVWMLAGMIILAGVAGERHDGLTAALVIFGAFSVYFVRSAFAQVTRTRSSR